MLLCVGDYKIFHPLVSAILLLLSIILTYHRSLKTYGDRSFAIGDALGTILIGTVIIGFIYSIRIY